MRASIFPENGLKWRRGVDGRSIGISGELIWEFILRACVVGNANTGCLKNVWLEVSEEIITTN